MYSPPLYFVLEFFKQDGAAIANTIVTWGTAFIVFYGVMKIVLNLLWIIFFGKKLEIKVGILDFMMKKIKSVKAQTWVEMSDEEMDKIASNYAAKISRINEKKKSGGAKMGFFKNVWNGVVANKQTILGVSSAVVGATLVATNVIDPVAIGTLLGGEYSGDGMIGVAATGLLFGINLNGVLNKGLEKPTEYKERVEVKKAAKLEIKKAKEDGTLDAERTKEKLMKQFGLDEAKANEIVAEKLKAAKAEAAKAEAEAELRKAEKLAKQLGVSVEKAKEIIADQKKNAK